MQVLRLALPLAEKEWLQEEMVMLSGSSSAALSTTIYFEGVDVARNTESFQYLLSTEKKEKNSHEKKKQRRLVCKCSIDLTEGTLCASVVW